MTIRTLSIAAGLLAACATFYYLSPIPVLTFDDMPRTSPGGTPIKSPDRVPDTDDLRILLSKGEGEKPTTIKVSIHNTHPKFPLTVLTWNTPLDPSALNTGVLLLADAAGGEIIPGPGLKLNRVLPPSRDDLVEISPEGKIEKEIELVAPWIPGEGRLVTVHAQGWWMAVWMKGSDEISDDELAAMSGKDVMKGPFRSWRDPEVEVWKSGEELKRMESR